jgi:hypothetical protein
MILNGASQGWASWTRRHQAIPVSTGRKRHTPGMRLAPNSNAYAKRSPPGLPMAEIDHLTWHVGIGMAVHDAPMFGIVSAVALSVPLWAAMLLAVWWGLR